MEFLSGLLGNVWSIFLIVLFFGGSIFVHELGHFLAARRRGVKADLFSIGFGPAIWKWHGKDGVEYRLAWIPIGGYVRLPQLADMPALEGESDTDVAQLPPVDYTSRMIVFAAGALFNVLFAFALACVLWQIGRPAPESITTTTIGFIIPKLKLPDGKEVDSPAAKAGLQVGDVIRRVDGRAVNDWLQFKTAMVLSTEVSAAGDRSAVLTIERAGQLQDISLQPVMTGDEGLRAIGVSSAYTAVIDSVRAGTPGAQLGFKAGDRFVAFDGTKAASFDQISQHMRAHKDRAIVLTVERDTRLVDITLPAIPKDKPHPLTGLQISIPYKLLHDSPWNQFYEILDSTFRTVWSLVSPRGDLSVSNLSGPIGIGRGFWDAAQSDYPIRFAIWFAILVNLNLAIFNLLPIPVLDGGHMLFATIGKLRGKALPFNFVATMQSIFVVLLLSMMAYVTVFGDLRRLVRDNRAEAQAKEAAAEQQKKAAEPAKP